MLKKIVLFQLICIMLFTGCSYGSPEMGMNEKKQAIEEIILSSADRKDFKDVLDGKLDGYDVSLPFDWSCDSIDNRNVCYWIHSFMFLDYVYALFMETGAEEYKTMLCDYMLDWIKNNPVPLEGNEWAWHDDATARRVFRLSYYLSEWKDAFTEDEYNLLLDSLKAQAELLATDDFYTKNHNHGMYQDMALVAYAVLLADGETQEEYFNLAKERSREYFEYVFTADGVHKEHSPSYHIDVSRAVQFYINAYKDIDEEFSEYLNDLYNKTTDFIVYLSLPDGTIPSIGDSKRRELDGVYDTAHCLYASTGGEEGEKPDESYISEEGGYAVMRSSWEDEANEATYLLFMASSHSSAHKHGDDLSFLLYHEGDLFVEAGNRNYNYQDEMTKYSYSGYGHNVLFINDEAFPVKFGANGFQSVYPEALETRITDFNIESDLKSVQGKQIRFPGIEQNRKISYDKAQNIVLIEDNILNSDLENNRKGTLIYHIDGDIQIEKTDHGWILLRDGDVKAVVTVSCEDVDIELSDFNEETQISPYNTWIFEGKSESKGGKLLKIDFPLDKEVVDIKETIELK